MRQFFKIHFYISISTFAFLALIAILLQSKASRGLPYYNLFFFFPSSTFKPPQTSSNIDNNNNGTTTSSSPSSFYDPLAHSLAIIHNTSTLFKSEEKRHRAMMRLSNAIDDVLRGRKKDENIENVEMELTRARALIKEAFQSRNSSSSSVEVAHFGEDDYVPKGGIYKNAFAFHRSYLLMEKMFKIYTYEEGEPPLFHYGICKNIYSFEGIFINSMEDTQYRTLNPNKAHVFFLPFSVVMILEHLFDPTVRDKAVLERTIVDYINVISTKYPFWNTSLGADHFMLSCHDWGPRATWYHPLLYFHSIRALCNANTSENFNPRKDASIPEINLVNGEVNGLISNGSSPSDRTILGFFAGGLHGHIRPLLLEHWKDDKDKDLHIYEKLPKELSYLDMMSKAKYCICPSGFEVASPRIVEAIYTGCVPVLISQNYILPYSDVLDWDEFSVRVSVSQIPDLKQILMDIPYDNYVKMYEGVKQVQRHFVINNPPKRYDVFHMTIHSIWLRRLNTPAFCLLVSVAVSNKIPDDDRMLACINTFEYSVDSNIPLSNWIINWIKYLQNKDHENSLVHCFVGTLWAIWVTRNRSIFDGHSWPADKTISIIHLSNSLTKPRLSLPRITDADYIRSSLRGGEPLQLIGCAATSCNLGTIEVDASWKHNKSSSCGWIATLHGGDVIGTGTRVFLAHTPRTAEAFGLLQACIWALKHGLIHVNFRSDCLNLVEAFADHAQQISDL